MKVTLLKGHPVQLAVAGTLGCNSSRSSAEILWEIQALPPEEEAARCKSVLANSFDRGHGAVGDQANFTFSLQGVSRLATLFFCQSAHSSFLQQSLRRVTAADWIPPPILNPFLQQRAMECMADAYQLYREMVEAGIPAEDARYILPLGTATNIQINTNARELCHYFEMAKSAHVPLEIHDLLCEVSMPGEPTEIQSYYPAPDLFADIGPLDGYDRTGLVGASHAWVNQCDVLSRAIAPRDVGFLSALKHIHFTFCYEMSLSALHQLVRQRTWDVTVETLKSAADRCQIRVPFSILTRPDFHSRFCACIELMIREYSRHLRQAARCVPSEYASAFYLLPHALRVRTMFHLNGWNAGYALGKRLCYRAQREIRDIAVQVAMEISREFPALGELCVPPCRLLGSCREKNPCGMMESDKEPR